MHLLQVLLRAGRMWADLIAASPRPDRSMGVVLVRAINGGIVQREEGNPVGHGMGGFVTGGHPKMEPTGRRREVRKT